MKKLRLGQTLVQILRIPEADKGQVEAALHLWLKVLLILGVGGIVTGAIKSVVGLIVLGCAWVGAAAGLHYLIQHNRLTLAANLLPVAFLLWVATPLPPEIAFAGPAYLLYVLPILAATSLCDPAAGWFWGEVLVVSLLLQFWLVSPHGQHTGWMILLLQGVIGLCWLLMRTFRDMGHHLRQQIDQGHTGIKIGRMATAAETPEAIIREAIGHIRETFGYSHVGLFTVDWDAETVDLVDAAGDGAVGLKTGKTAVGLYSSRVVAVAVRQKRKCIATSWEKTPDEQGRPIEFTYPRLAFTRIELAIPLMVGVKIFGVMDIHRTDVTPFSELELDLLEGLAGNIANALNVAFLNEQLRADNLRMVAELDVSRRLQQMLLPKPEELQRIEDLDIAGYMDPAEEVGGDYYDVLQYEGQLKIGIGDVTGHGLESGVVMLMLQTAVRTLLAGGETDNKRFMDVLNRALHDNIRRMNVDRSLSLALLDYHKGQVRLSGQHEQLIVVRQDGAVELMDTLDLGFPVGVVSNIADFVAESRVELAAGDGIVLYSDGVVEAENVAGEFYGLDRLCQVVSQNWGQSSETIKDAIVADVRAFIGQHTVYDDLTLLVMRQK